MPGDEIGGLAGEPGDRATGQRRGASSRRMAVPISFRGLWESSLPFANRMAFRADSPCHEKHSGRKYSPLPPLNYVPDCFLWRFPRAVGAIVGTYVFTSRLGVLGTAEQVA